MLRTITVVIVTLVLAFAAWANAAATFFSKFAPDRVIQFDSNSARALTNLTERAGARKDQREFLKIARENSLQALRNEPLSPRALRQLGVYYAMTGSVDKGRRLVELSSTLSRRDAPGQLWLVEYYLRHGKPREALQGLDIVMRTQPETQEAAYSALGNALADPEFRKVFLPYVRSNPPWLKPFIQFNVSLPHPEILSRSLMQIRPLPNDVIDDRTRSALLGALVNRSPIEEARAFYLAIPGVSAKPLTSIEFARPADAFRFPPIGWEAMNDGNVQGFGDVANGVVSIEALAAPGASGTAARKLLFLRPGTYRWSGNANLGDMASRGTGSVTLLCNTAPGQWSRAASMELKSGPNQFVFAIGAACPAQMLAIGVTGADTQSDVNIRVSQMRLTPANGAAVKMPPPNAGSPVPSAD